MLHHPDGMKSSFHCLQSGKFRYGIRHGPEITSEMDATGHRRSRAPARVKGEFGYFEDLFPIAAG